MTDFRMAGGCQCGAVRYVLTRCQTLLASAIAVCARNRLETTLEPLRTLKESILGSRMGRWPISAVLTLAIVASVVIVALRWFIDTRQGIGLLSRSDHLMIRPD